MTRKELIAALEAMRPTIPPPTLYERDMLRFWIWWHSGSTEAGKVEPRSPSIDYIESKLGGNANYVHSLDAAIHVVLPHRYWLIGKGKTRPTEPLYGAQVLIGEQVTAEAESDVSPALALVIAGLKDRLVLLT
jgi:hypothetical protein